MYEGFYRLKVDPFRLSADHRFCYPHRSYARAKAYVQYALYRAEGFVLVTGRPGTGKTTLVNDLLATLPNKEVVAGTLVSTQLEAEDLLLMAGHAFGLEFESPQKALVLQRLIEYFNEQHRKGMRTLLIIDEAQDLAASALEELRLLTNLQYQGAPLLQIALLGQDSLRDIVRTPEMEQVHQRLIAAWQLEPLTLEETVGYVRHRLEHAGWKGDPAFEPGVLEIVYRFSKGVPRRINLICSRLLLHGFIGELHSISVDDAENVMRDLRREELALPEYEAEGAVAAQRAAGQRRDVLVAPPNDEVWKGIDLGLFGPNLAGEVERPATRPAERVPRAAPTRGAAPPITATREGRETEPAEASPPPITASREPEDRARPRAAARGREGGRQTQTPSAVVPPVHIVPERESIREDEPKQRQQMPGWVNAMASRPRLWSLIGVLAVVWLALLAVLVMRSSDEVPATAAVQERSTEASEPGSMPVSPREAASGPAERVAASDPRVKPDADRPAASGLQVESDVGRPGTGSVAPAMVAPLPEPPVVPDPESARQDVPPLVGKVFFRVNSTTVDREFEPILDEIAATLLESGEAYAEVIGYTDRFGSLDYNVLLSRERARSVANRLIMRGVPAEQLVVEGQGPRDPEPGEGISREEERVVVITVHR